MLKNQKIVSQRRIASRQNRRILARPYYYHHKHNITPDWVFMVLCSLGGVGGLIHVDGRQYKLVTGRRSVVNDLLATFRNPSGPIWYFLLGAYTWYNKYNNAQSDTRIVFTVWRLVLTMFIVYITSD